MLRLLDAKRNGNIISARVIPEKCKESGYVEVDLTTRELVKVEMPKGYERMYPGMARTGLCEMVDEGKMMDDKLIMWY